jgi:hypothetical protein
MAVDLESAVADAAAGYGKTFVRDCLSRPALLRQPPEILLGQDIDVLERILEPGIDLARWRREPQAPIAVWLDALPPARYPTVQLQLRAADVAAALHVLPIHRGSVRSARFRRHGGGNRRAEEVGRQLARSARVQQHVDADGDEGAAEFEVAARQLRI